MTKDRNACDSVNDYLHKMKTQYGWHQDQFFLSPFFMCSLILAVKRRSETKYVPWYNQKSTLALSSPYLWSEV